LDEIDVENALKVLG
jgi:ubiquitin carboxyl-terminal hydrolase 25/28